MFIAGMRGIPWFAILKMCPKKKNATLKGSLWLHHQEVILLIHNNKTFLVKTDLPTHSFLCHTVWASVRLHANSRLCGGFNFTTSPLVCLRRLKELAIKFSILFFSFFFFSAFVLAKITGWQKRPYRAIPFIYWKKKRYFII